MIGELRNKLADLARATGELDLEAVARGEALRAAADLEAGFADLAARSRDAICRTQFTLATIRQVPCAGPDQGYIRHFLDSTGADFLTALAGLAQEARNAAVDLRLALARGLAARSDSPAARAVLARCLEGAPDHEAAHRLWRELAQG